MRIRVCAFCTCVRACVHGQMPRNMVEMCDARVRVAHSLVGRACFLATTAGFGYFAYEIRGMIWTLITKIWRWAPTPTYTIVFVKI